MAELPKCISCKRKFSPLPATASDHVPLLLKCSHTFCKRCITKWVTGRKEISCPTCNITTECINGKETVAELWPNIYYAGIMACGSDIVSLSKCFSHIDELAEVSSPKQEKSLNTLCSECVRAVATCRCCQCCADMCEKCFSSIHNNFRLLQQHTKVDLRASLTETECTEHNRLLEFYCEDDKTPVCPECMISQAHRSHKIVQMSCKYESYKQKIRCAKLQAESAFLLSSKVKSRIKNEVRCVKMDAYEQAKVIHSQFLAYVSKLQVDYLTIIRELEYCTILSCDELLCLLSEIEEKELRIKDACSDAEIMLSEDSRMRVVLDPEKLLSVLQEFASLPLNFEKTLEFGGSNDCSNDIAMKSEYFEFTPSPEMLRLFKKFGEIEITKGFSFKVNAIGNNVGILEAMPVPIEMEKSPLKSQVVELKEEPCPTSQESVKVTYVESPTNFKVQRISDGSHIASIERSLNLVDGKFKSSRLQTVSVGELCAANYDATGRWYRARVVEKVTDCSKSVSNLTKTDTLNVSSESVSSSTPPRIHAKDIVEVCFIDYGNTIMSKVKCLRRLPQELKELPCLGISCSLSNIEPTAGTWTVEANEYFAKLVNEQQLLMTTKRRENGIRYVNLHKPCSEEIDDDTPLNIADTIIFLGFAKHKGSPAQRKPDVPARKFLTPTLLGLNSLTGVSISYLESPDRFYVQQTDTNKVYLEEMERKIQIWVKKRIDGKKAKAFSDVVHRLQLLCPKVGMICLAYFPPNGVWYRAQVIGVNEDRTVDIDFVDFGNKETIHFSGLIKIPEIFTRLPVQALCCKLHCVKPLPGEETFSSACVKRFAELCSNSELVIMDVRVISKNVYAVDLYDSSVDGSDLSSISNHLHREGLLKYEKHVASRPVLSKNAVMSMEQDAEDYGKTRVRITHVISPASFYIQTEASCMDLNKMMGKLQSRVEETLNEPIDETWKVGMLCTLKSNKEKRWCRGRIHSVAADSNICCVILFDFGWRESMLVTFLKKLPEEFRDTNHAYLRHCSLGGVHPAGGSDKWTSTAIDCFKELTDGEECLMEMLQDVSPDQKAVVDLWIDMPQNDDDSDSESSMAISKALIMKGVALPIRRHNNPGISGNRPKASVAVDPSVSLCDQPDNSGVEETHSKFDRNTDTLTDKGDVENSTCPECNNNDVKVNGVADEPDALLTQAPVKNILPENISPMVEMPYPVVPVFSAGKRVRCSVSHVHDIGIFYIKRHVAPDDVEDDNGLMNESFEWKMALMGAQTAEKMPVLLHEVQDTMPCLCLYDNDQRWHRAVVLSKTILPLVLVQYVDFGTLEEVPVDKLRHISEALVQLPVQAIMCGLADPPALSEDEEKQILFLEKFCASVQGRYLEAEIHAVDKPASDFTHYLCLHSVSLYFDSGTKVEVATL